MTRDRRIALALIGPVVLAGAFSFISLWRTAGREPANADYQAIARALEAERVGPEDDAVLVLPPWSLRPFQFVDPRAVVSSDQLGDALLERHRRLFVVAEADSDRYLRVLSRRAGVPIRSTRFGNASLYQFEGPALGRRFDFRAHLDEAHVRMASAGGATRVNCGQKIRLGYACPGRMWWEHVSREWLRVTENGSEAIWAHPPPPDERLEITFPDVSLGSRLLLRAGYTRLGADRAQVPLRLSVLVDGEVAGVAVRRPAFDFRRDEFVTGRWAGQIHSVTFRLESLGSNHYQHFAFDAVAVDP
jgi:hypothetical protein